MWHNQGVERTNEARSRARGAKRAPKPLTETALSELAIHYVSRFATTRAKLVTYLSRKVRERGWEGERDPALNDLAERLVGLGYVDDAAFALAKAGSLSSRGYGEGRVRQALLQAGVGEEDGEPAREFAAERAAEAALRYARRKRIGPFALSAGDPKTREKSLAAMIRAGHDFAMAKAVISASPGQEMTADQLMANRS